MEKVLYLAGGCFWGLEKYMEVIPGVTDAVSGYANGIWEENRPLTYKAVCTGRTGFRETVKVVYEEEQVSIDALLLAYFQVIDPTLKNRQGHDIGTQYQTGIYYVDEEQKKEIDRIVSVVIGRYPVFYVEIEPLRIFIPAEEEHQNYLTKHPEGYCHISRGRIDCAASMIVDPVNYRKPSEKEIKESLSDIEYEVTQNSGTERPFTGKYWDFDEKGIYVDIVTKEPLFTSMQKYKSSCGWPSFYEGIDENAFVYLDDDRFGMERVEVRSRAGDSHLGHVFTNEPESPNGVRYCMNSAALEFIPFEEMEEKGYGYLLSFFDRTT